MIDVSRPASPNCRQCCSVGFVKLCAKLMPQLMAQKILRSSKSGNSVMGNTSAPHDFTHSIIIFLILICLCCIFDQCTHQSFCNLICQFISMYRCEITFNCMHKNVYNSARKLVFWKCVCQLRIHNCKFRTDQIASDSRFVLCLFICQYRRITHLASGC